MDRTEAMICQHFYWVVIRKYVHKGVLVTVILSNVKNGKNIYSKFPDKEAGKIP